MWLCLCCSLKYFPYVKHGLRVPNTANTAAVTGYKCTYLLLIGVRCSLKSVSSTLGKIFLYIFLIEKQFFILLCTLRLNIISYNNTISQNSSTVARICPHFRQIIWYHGQEKHWKKQGISLSPTASPSHPAVSFWAEDLSPSRVNVS